MRSYDSAGLGGPRADPGSSPHGFAAEETRSLRLLDDPGRGLLAPTGSSRRARDTCGYLGSRFGRKEIEGEREKWARMLPQRTAELLPWLLVQDVDFTSNLFAFCVAATLDGTSAVDQAHPINELADLLHVDPSSYWKPTRASYFDHMSKARIFDVVATAVSPDAAVDLQGMKKGDAAAAAELRMADSGWLPEVLTNREIPERRSYGDINADNDAKDTYEATGTMMATKRQPRRMNRRTGNHVMA